MIVSHGAAVGRHWPRRIRSAAPWFPCFPCKWPRSRLSSPSRCSAANGTPGSPTSARSTPAPPTGNGCPPGLISSGFKNSFSQISSCKKPGSPARPALPAPSFTLSVFVNAPQISSCKNPGSPARPVPSAPGVTVCTGGVSAKPGNGVIPPPGGGKIGAGATGTACPGCSGLSSRGVGNKGRHFLPACGGQLPCALLAAPGPGLPDLVPKVRIEVQSR